MREMKDSGIEWIGKIPKEWEKAKLKHFVKINSGEMISKEEYVDNGDFPIIGSNGEIGRTNKYNNEEKVITTGRVGTIGTIHIVKKSWITDNALIVKSNNINQKYLSYIIVNFDFKHMLSGTAQPLITSTNLKNQYITLPPLAEQQKISTYLDTKCTKIDSIIEKQEKVIEKLKEYKLSVITEAVTKGLNPDVKMKDSEIKFVDSIPEQWENRKMLSVLSMRVVDGPHESPELLDDGIPYISATAIENGKINFEMMRGYISEEYCTLCDFRYKPERNDILVIKLGASTGQVAMVETDDRFNIWVPLAAVRCNEQAIPRFVYYAFQSDYFIKQMELSWTFGTQQTLGVKTIERLRILITNTYEQQQIADYLDKKCSAIDKSIEQKQAIIEKLKEYKKSLIYEVVTGKRGV